MVEFESRCINFPRSQPSAEEVGRKWIKAYFDMLVSRTELEEAHNLCVKLFDAVDYVEHNHLYTFDRDYTRKVRVIMELGKLKETNGGSVEQQVII